MSNPSSADSPNDNVELARGFPVICAFVNDQLGAAGLDAYEEEADHSFEDRSGGVIEDDVLARLTTFPKVIVTSHHAFLTREALREIASTTVVNARDLIVGRDLENRTTG
jgi:D-lactate dehydrogenase